MSRILIALDAGHGGEDSGATGFGLMEKNWALKMVFLVSKYLGHYDGVAVTYTRAKDVFVPIPERCKHANEMGCNLFLSFHNNAGGGEGFESYVAATASATSRKVQEKVTNDILAFLKGYGVGAHGDPTKEDTQSHRGRIGVLRDTHMPAVLFENLFIDNEKDNKLLKDDSFNEKLAQAYAKSIAEFYGLKPKN